MADKTLAELVQGVATNPALVEFPADKWGSTRALKKEGLKAASDIRGQQDKHDIVVQTLTVLLAHVKKRFDIDVAAKIKYAEDQRALEATRSIKEQVTGLRATELGQVTRPN